MSELLEPSQSRFIATTPNFVVVPTYGCFVAGYLLIVPRAHVLSFGGLGAGALAEAQGLVDSLADRLRAVYKMPVLGSDLGGWLADRLAGQPITSLTELPSGEGSYIAVRDQDAALTV